MAESNGKKAGLEGKISPFVLGIDLGTSNSVVSVYKKGKAEAIEINGQDVNPSVVNYRDDGSTLVGHQAKRKVLIDPDNTVVSIKRHMGEEGYKVNCRDKELAPEDVTAQILDIANELASNSFQLINLFATVVATSGRPECFDRPARGDVLSKDTKRASAGDV